jgi:hypothetical protein
VSITFAVLATPAGLEPATYCLEGRRSECAQVIGKHHCALYNRQLSGILTV